MKKTKSFEEYNSGLYLGFGHTRRLQNVNGFPLQVGAAAPTSQPLCVAFCCMRHRHVGSGGALHATVRYLHAGTHTWHLRSLLARDCLQTALATTQTAWRS
jgi:hypothetical protein